MIYSLGNKIKDWELIGIPHIIIIGKNESSDNCVTYKTRNDDEKRVIELDMIKEVIAGN